MVPFRTIVWWNNNQKIVYKPTKKNGSNDVCLCVYIWKYVEYTLFLKNKLKVRVRMKMCACNSTLFVFRWFFLFFFKSVKSTCSHHNSFGRPSYYFSLDSVDRNVHIRVSQFHSPPPFNLVDWLLNLLLFWFTFTKPRSISQKKN